MRDSFRPSFPGYSVTTIPGRRDEIETASFDLVAYPDKETPAVTEFLPHSSAVPVGFEAAKCRGVTSVTWGARHVNSDFLSTDIVHAVYTPDGEVDSDSAYAACRLMVPDDSEGCVTTVDNCYQEEVCRTFKDDIDQTVQTDWITSERQETTARGFDKTTYVHRRPLLYLDNPASVSRPVLDYGVVIQATDWCVIETVGYLYPDPDQNEALDIATSLADHVLHQTIKYPTPDVATPETSDVSNRES